MRNAYKFFQQLPDDLKDEVLDHIEFLLERNARRRRSLGWHGGLKELRKKYDSDFDATDVGKVTPFQAMR
ncbi:DUF2281 domain-containing protein [Thermococcus piezophilus]|uniref:XRE family transcriptional regulator n=1 Tax=Thermococcus piezophilus TaxID=1712654 RepID=A0A172WFN9_9EURY|nr:DUF2281 domain-containing protein [Thermococcus piezophilus]ANF22238.1 XRE family transcriptional regulator [Thermococcus piezophilus]